MHWAEALAVGLQAKRAGQDAFNGVDGVDDFQDGELGGVTFEGKTAPAAALGREDVRLGEGLQNLDQVARCGVDALGEKGVLVLGKSGYLDKNREKRETRHGKIQCYLE